MDSLTPEVADVFRTVITGGRDQINQAINNYREPGYIGCHRYFLYQKKDSDGRNLLHYVCMYNTDEVATWMLSLTDDNGPMRSPIPKISDKFGATAVMYAARAGKVKFVQEWIKQGGNINTTDIQGLTILDYCLGLGETFPKQTGAASDSAYGKMNQIKQVTFTVMKKGVKSSALEKKGITPIEYIDKYLFFIDCDANIPMKIRQEIYESVIMRAKPKEIHEEQTHLCVAICFKLNHNLNNSQRVAKFEEMILNGSLKINETDSNGMTALHHLCYYEYDTEPYGLREALVAKMLDLGADPNIKDTRGYTPLMCAIEKGYVVIYNSNDPRSTNEQGMGRLLKAYDVNKETLTIPLMSADKIRQKMDMFEVFRQEQEQINDEVMKHFKEFQQKINQMKDSNEGFQMENTKLRQTLNQRSEELLELKSEVKELHNKQNDLVEEINELKTKLKVPDLVTNDAPISSLLLSNVTLTDVCRHLETDVEFRCLPDASLKDLQATINKDNQKYNRVYLVTGCPSDENDVQALIVKYRNITEATKNKSKRVIVSSILPTLKEEEVNAKIELINKSLSVLCQETGCEFVNNNRTFKYGDGTINEDCFDEEGEGLSEVGIKRLLRNLQLFTTKKKQPPTDI